ncbi:MAG: hypothetical protein RLY93_02760 [Sumerlaeia bacterium]
MVHFKGSFTKEFDGDVGLVYMYQRWYNGKTGTFVSKSPVVAFMENPYGAFEANPVSRADVLGQYSHHVTPGERWVMQKLCMWSKGKILRGAESLKCLATVGDCYAVAHLASKKKSGGENNAMRHCVWQCCLAKKFGVGTATEFGEAHGDVGLMPLPTDDSDTAADKVNNRIGRGFGAGGTPRGGSCDDSCVEKCQKAWDNGGLRPN